MAKTITGGVKITVDTQDLFKFTRTAEQLNAPLTKSQKALKLVYNEQALINERVGKRVEGVVDDLQEAFGKLKEIGELNERLQAFKKNGGYSAAPRIALSPSNNLGYFAVAM